MSLRAREHIILSSRLGPCPRREERGLQRKVLIIQIKPCRHVHMLSNLPGLYHLSKEQLPSLTDDFSLNITLWVAVISSLYILVSFTYEAANYSL